jgi:hypothetical protein
VTETIVTLHAIVRWLILVAAIASLVTLFVARGRGGWTRDAGIATQVYAGLLGLQVILGLWIWIAQERWTGDNPFLSWIHPVAMLLAVGVAHGGLARARRAPDDAARGRIALWSVLGSLVLILLAVPWFES